MHTLTRMRRTMLYGLAVVIAAAGLTGVAQASAAPRSVCTLKSVDIAPAAVHGEDFGVLKCPKPFGAGVQHNTGILSPTSATTGTLKGTAELFFAKGSVRARFSLSYKISGSAIAYGGTAKVVRGTGAFKGISGSAKLKGASADGGTHGKMTLDIRAKLP